MNIVVAIDSFKGSLSSMEAGNAVKEGILDVLNANVIVKPMADGGEGTVEALLSGLKGTKVELEVTGPLGERVQSSYAILDDSNMAVIEMAAAAGIKLVPENKRNPFYTTTYGVGEMIEDAILRGCRNFIIGIGGSATNDGGLGMLEALGYQFFDENGHTVGGTGGDLLKIKSLSCKKIRTELDSCSFHIACDVTNPLFGNNGAANIFGPQKGANSEIVEILDKGLRNYSNVVKRYLGKDMALVPGTGAAGGLGYAFLSFLNGELQSGVNIILDTIHLEQDIKNADIVITGEGKLDAQTPLGKAPIGVAKLAKKYGKKVIAFAGGTTEDAVLCNKEGIDAYFSIMQLPMSLENAMEYDTAYQNLVSTSRQVFRLIQVLR